MIKVHLVTFLGVFICCVPQSAWSQGALEAETSAAIRYFDASFADTCQPYSETKWLFEDEEETNPVRLEISYKSKYAATNDGTETAVIYQFFCSSGAYNRRFVYLKQGDEHFSALSFATPELEIKYENSQEEKVSSIEIVGYTSYSSVTNSAFDLTNSTLTEQSYWRGLGDAYQKTTYLFSEGQFVLKRFEVDASYDGQLEPQLVVNY